jgi:SAM-dependent methyltransferase
MTMSDLVHWDKRYQEGDSPWDTGQPSSELVRVVKERPIPSGRAIDLGCGTGVNAVWLAQQGFETTGIDLSPRAIELARKRADDAGVRVRFLAADLLNPPAEIGGPYDFFFDRGCYHVVRRQSATRYLTTLLHLSAAGSLGLVLAGNAREPLVPGPPVVTEDEIRSELGQEFTIEWLREFRFDQPEGFATLPLAWSCLLRR